MPDKTKICHCVGPSEIHLLTETSNNALNKLRRSGFINENIQTSNREEAANRLRAKLERKRAHNP